MFDGYLNTFRDCPNIFAGTSDMIYCEASMFRRILNIFRLIIPRSGMILRCLGDTKMFWDDFNVL